MPAMLAMLATATTLAMVATLAMLAMLAMLAPATTLAMVATLAMLATRGQRTARRWCPTPLAPVAENGCRIPNARAEPLQRGRVVDARPVPVARRSHPAAGCVAS